MARNNWAREKDKTSIMATRDTTSSFFLLLHWDSPVPALRSELPGDVQQRDEVRDFGQQGHRDKAPKDIFVCPGKLYTEPANLVSERESGDAAVRQVDITWVLRWVKMILFPLHFPLCPNLLFYYSQTMFVTSPHVVECVYKLPYTMWSHSWKYWLLNGCMNV